MFPLDIAKYFETILIVTIMIMSISKYHSLASKDSQFVISEERTNWPILIFGCILLCILIGFRPLNIQYFGDTWVYASKYNNRLMLERIILDPYEKDTLFNLIMYYCSNYFDVSVFFLLVAVGYIFSAMAGFYRLFKNATGSAMLFFLGAFSFWAYGVNGIRNGLAGSLVIMAFALLLTYRTKLNLILGIGICFLAAGIHKTMLLPIVCFVFSRYIKSLKPIVGWWFLSIFLYIGFHGFFETFFSNLGLDDRLSGYIGGTESYGSLGHKIGFRPDFLIYSFMPILLGIYVTRHCKNIGTIYPVLLKTYILSNSFWILLMNAAFSNRFAYLSWFMMPLVIAYPVLKLNIWDNKQGRNTSLILLAHSSFTFFMYFIYNA